MIPKQTPILLFGPVGEVVHTQGEGILRVEVHLPNLLEVVTEEGFSLRVFFDGAILLSVFSEVPDQVEVG